MATDGDTVTADIRDLLSLPPGGLPGIPLFSKVWGSRSHNMALPTSDTDYLMVFITPTEELLSLHPPKNTVDGKDPDFESHEVGKFCNLLLKGNPSMVECLFTERHCTHWSEWWGQLKDRRMDFLSQRVVNQYLGYGRGQLHRFDAGSRLHTKGGKANEKWLYHMIRVLTDAKRIASGEAPIVWKEGAERDLLMEVRSGKMGPRSCVSWAKVLIAEIDALAPWPLPEQGNAEFLNEWLLAIRRENWRAQ